MRSAEERSPKYDLASVGMLAIIMLSLGVIFLVGMGIMVSEDRFEASDIVAVLSPALAAVGTVAAGVFGYTLGARGTAEAQRTATATAESAVAARREADAVPEFSTPRIKTVERIATRALEAEVPGETRQLSVDDLKTLLDAARSLETRLGKGRH
jgi:hypothetical protein